MVKQTVENVLKVHSSTAGNAKPFKSLKVTLFLEKTLNTKYKLKHRDENTKRKVVFSNIYKSNINEFPLPINE